MITETTIKPTAKNERLVERKMNGILMDTCLIDFETTEYLDSKVYTVITWYNTKEPYAFRTKEKDMEFSNVSEAKKEMSRRANNWKKLFSKL